MIVVVDNYDSFTYNLVQAVGRLDAKVLVVRNDRFDPDEVVSRSPRAILVSPGPGRPEAAGRSMPLIAAAERAGIPLLGVCLGHQAIAALHGGRVERAPSPRHGKSSPVAHDGSPLFAGLPNPFAAGRYHSLVVTEAGAELLETMLAPDHPLWDKADEIKEVEHKCDVLTHEIIQRLNRTFVTPLDREDIHALARSLDDVMDAIDASATLVRLYRLERVREGARELAQIITACTREIRPALQQLEQNKGLITHAIEINRLENEADRVHQQAVSHLFDDERDPILVMKWKETLDFLEMATDRCEDVANVLEGVMVKQG